MKQLVLVIALLVAALYLAVSFLTHAWAWTWLIWVGYALYRYFGDRPDKRADENKSDLVSR